eukprot:TRINITY_DN17588_c0_g1_i1.p1 TRINITY_DN17588_c0_g1~~TRINITY_DN17588_c0_g1_i1.p1  ORF type:complete len:289 (+),score=58.74 TRINITY_DN17588_c0_g1_i1:128-868(+)
MEVKEGYNPVPYSGPPPSSVPTASSLRPDQQFHFDVEARRANQRQAEQDAIFDETVNSARQGFTAKAAVLFSKTKRTVDKKMFSMQSTLEANIRTRDKMHDQSKYAQLLPEVAAHESLITSYSCQVLSKGIREPCEIFITEASLCIVATGKESFREKFPWDSIVALQKAVVLETTDPQRPFITPLPDASVVPTCIQLFTTHETVIQLTGFSNTKMIAAQRFSLCSEEVYDRVYSYIYHSWKRELSS